MVLKRLGQGALALLLLAVAAAGAGFLWMRGSLPVIDGERSVSGLARPVEIVRDRHGVPHVLAENEEDALFALGYVHAQDRLWQMEMHRRIGAGRLAEVLGPAAVDTDRLLRGLGLYRRAEATLPHLAPRSRRRIAAYAGGVNASMEAREGPLPPEFLLFGFEPEPWSAADTLVWAKVMALDLGREWTRDLMRLRLSEFLSPDRILDFHTPYRPGRPRGVVPREGPLPASAGTLDPRVSGARVRPAPLPRFPAPPVHLAETRGAGGYVDPSPRPSRPVLRPPPETARARTAPGQRSAGYAERSRRRPPPGLQRSPETTGARAAPRPGPLATLLPADHAPAPFLPLLRPRSGPPGSNSWVIGGARSATGKPLLANDPHLGLSVPSLWYFAHLSWPGREVVGATFPGMPMVVLGHNGRVAWGFTNTGADVQDLFIEQLDPEDPARYRTPTGYQPFEVRREVIVVKGAEDVVMRVRETRHGPVLDDALDSAADASPAGHVLALAWTALREDDLTLQAGLGLPEVRDWAGFVATFRDFHSPQQNVAYADVDGNIGFLAPGRVPVRSSTGGKARTGQRAGGDERLREPDPEGTEARAGGHRSGRGEDRTGGGKRTGGPATTDAAGGAGPRSGHDSGTAGPAGDGAGPAGDGMRIGTMPLPGWDARHDWQGFIPYEALPRVYNPPGGAIVTANHPVVTPDYPHHLSFEWAAGFRAERIMARLAARPRHDLASFRALQQDRVSHFARALLPRLRSVAPGPDAGSLAARARRLLDGWEGDMDPEGPEPLIFHAWIWEFARLVSADELGPLQREAWGRKGAFVLRILEAREIWCDDVVTARTETCDDMLVRALDRAVDGIAGRQGGDPATWRWGREHRVRGEHRPLGRSPLARLFNLEGPAPGSMYSVNSFDFSPLDDEAPFLSTHGPSLRAIYDLADLDRSLFIQSSGQSGNVLSPLYRNFEARWRGGEYITIPTRREAFEADALGRLRLIPR